MTTICPKPRHAFVLAALVCVPLSAFAQGPRSTGVAVTPPPRPASTTPSPAARTATSASSPGWTEQDFRLGAGDKLRIEVYGQPQLSQSLQIRPDGKITLPLVGDVLANGRTSNELRDSIAGSLKEYVNNPVVTVIVQ